MLIHALAISLAIQVFFFIFAAGFKTDKVTDLSYGLTFVIIAWYLASVHNLSRPQTILVMLITLWGIRLAGYLLIRIIKTKRDKRFDGIRENFFKFAQFWTLQAFSVWIIMLPSIIFLTSNVGNSFYVLFFIGLSIWMIGITLETIADWQKFAFKNNPNNKGLWINSGLWKYSRHPNYFGEMLCWWGLFVIAIPSLGGLRILSIIGPLFITILLLFITGIPTLEKKYDTRYKQDKNYQKYKKQTSLLIPLPLKK